MRKQLLIAFLLLSIGITVGVLGCNTIETYDVIVVGGDPEGVSAAVTSARNGMKTLLIEEDDVLGGLMTSGGLNFIDMCNGRDGTLLTRGTFQEFYNAVGGTAFDIEQAKQVFWQMTEAEENLTVMLNTSFIKPIMKGETIRGVIAEQNGMSKKYKATAVIDATVDADVAAAAGAEYTYLGEDYGHPENVTGVTLVFELSGVDWQQVSQYLNGDGNANTGATEKAAWGYNEESFSYIPQDSETRLRGLNLALQKNGNVLVNGFIIFGVDPLNEESKYTGLERGKRELEAIVPYLQEHFVGFSNVQLAGTAQQLYVRESRHVIGEYQLTLEDVLGNCWFEDTIAIGSYPVDVPPNATQKVGYIVGNPDRYGVPFRCLVPKTVDGLLVVGRSASYTSLAAGSARVIPLGMAEGDAAGVAAAYAKQHSMTFRAICDDCNAILDIQQSLRAQGAYLERWDPIIESVEHSWAYNGVRCLRDLGLLYGGYQNDYRLEDIATAAECNEWCFGIARLFEKEETVWVEEPITCETVQYAVAKLIGVHQKDVFQALEEAGVMDVQLREFFIEEEVVPQRAEVIQLLSNAYQFLVNEK